jgi:hypothetical protein
VAGRARCGSPFDRNSTLTETRHDQPADGTSEYVPRYVSAEQAVTAFKHHTDNVATAIGAVDRVIITDGLDFTNIEWRAGKGFTCDGENYYPTPPTGRCSHET